ncbi:MAG: VOC family protein [Cyclobacteriaceae bacterium]|nr:VOC family protein [Cyclobacteriaceae bacterium]
MYKRINGLQHVGVGVPNHAESWKWYRKFFGMDIAMFNGEAEAPLMQIYTKGDIINKRAAMILNLQGGLAMEVVSPVSFKATDANVSFELGDLGIFIAQIKSPDVEKTHTWFKDKGADIIGEIQELPYGGKTFYLKDPNGLLFQVVPGGGWYTKLRHVTGGPVGSTVGVTDIDKALTLYADLLGYDKIIFDETRVFDDWKNTVPGGDKTFRRVRLAQSNKPGGGFAKVMADTYIELAQAIDYTPKKIYADRLWGDIGFVHLGFDVRGMKELGKDLAEKGFGFTCDTKDTLDMGGTTRVHCTYIEDPDGTLIELIEVYKIPIIEKLGIFLNLENRDPLKPLPDFMLKALRFGRIKD